MGIHKPDNHEGILPTPGFQQQIPPRIADAAHRDNIIDTNIVPHQAILTHIEGSPWIINWYSQVLGQDTAVQPPQIDAGGTTGQQYSYIDRMEIRLQGKLEHSWDDTKNEFTITGTAISFPYFLPNQHDVFFGDIGDGRTGIFILAKPEPKSYFKETVWEFQFTLLADSTQQEYRTYLEAHVVKRYHYSLDYLQLGRNPLMTTEAYNIKDQLIRSRAEILGRFLEEFYSHEYRALLLKHQGKMVYDPLLQTALTSLCNRSEHPYIPKIIARPTDESFELRVPTVWDLLVRNQEDLHFSITKKMWVLPRSSFSVYVHNHGLRYSRLDFIVYPDMSSPHCPNGQGLAFYKPSQIDLQLHYNHFILNGLENWTEHATGVVEEEPYVEPPLMRPVSDDEYYVFTKAFYEDIPGCKTMMELLVLKMLKHERFDYQPILDLCKQSRDWEPLDRYYYSLVMVALCNYATKNL